MTGIKWAHPELFVQKYTKIWAYFFSRAVQVDIPSQTNKNKTSIWNKMFSLTGFYVHCDNSVQKRYTWSLNNVLRQVPSYRH